MRVVVHNTDGVNAYAAEVASLLARRGMRVAFVDALNSQHRPVGGVRWRPLLPANFGSVSRVRQLISLLRGLGATLWAGAVGGHVVVVAFWRFPLEALAFALLARTGRPVVVVVHNPVPREAETTFTRRARRALLRRARAVVVHAERLRADVDPVAADRVRVCPHPPYLHTVGRAASSAQSAVDGRRWVAFVGTLRWDKGVDLVPQVLARVPAAVRQGLGLVVCGRGELTAEAWQQLGGLGVTVRDVTSPTPVPHETMLDVLAQRPLVLAPYVAATQSGTVILALTVGCRVVAFDNGGIPDVLSEDGLVPTGDLDAMAQAVAEGRGGTAAVPIEVWARQTEDAWCEILQATCP